ncbi:Uncharacterised protein [Streptococcus pneumoniae]|nr:Uncharacterised protein [Streptococcus pneumoniae]
MLFESRREYQNKTIDDFDLLLKLAYGQKN